VLASGTTAIAGFAALLFSDFPMLRDFGAVTVVNLTVSLLGVMVVLPAALMWSEQRGPLRLPRSRAEVGALLSTAARSLRAGGRAFGGAVRALPSAVRRAAPKARRRLRDAVPFRRSA
jgi:predicted exporter